MFLLKPSALHGIGVFTTSPIRKGKNVDIYPIDDYKFVDEKEAPESERFFFDTFCVVTVVDGVKGYWAPKDFRQMSLAWYLNHSKSPNLAMRDGGETFWASRDIAAGEEVTIDYADLDEHIDNSEGL